MSSKDEFEEFCGGEFWNSTLTWYSPNPILTNCFLWTVVAWIPCLYIVLLSPIYFFCYLRNVNNEKTEYWSNDVSVLYVLKMIVSCGLIGTGISCLIYCVVLYVTKDMPVVAIVTPIFITLAFAESAIIIKIENDKRLVTSGFLSFFYFLLSISSVIYGYSLVWQYLYHWDSHTRDIFHVTAYTICYVLFTTLIIIMLITFCLPDPVAVRILKKKNPNVCPESTMTFFSRIVFTWIFRLLLTGYKKALTIADLWTRFDGQDATLNRETFFLHWKKKRSVWKIMARMFGPKLLLSHISMFLSIIAMFVVPFLLSIFIEYFDDPSMESWKGYLCGVAFFVNYVFESMCWQQMIYVGFDVGARVKATLTSVAFQKILLLDTSSVEITEEQALDFIKNHDKTSKKANPSAFPATPGEAVNLISTDIWNIGEAMTQLHQVWAIPLQTAMVLGILWWLLDTSLVFMIVIVFVVLIIIFITSRFLKSLQISQMLQKDGRIKIFTEVINGIKLLKLYTWEGVFEERVQDYRKAELSNLRRFFYINAINIFSSLYTPNLATFITFSIYSWFFGPLTARKAFTSKSVFNLLQYQLLFMPIICSHIVKVRVSLKRMEAFLNLPELKNYVESTPVEKHTLAIEVTKGTFSWDSGQEPTLKNIDVKLKRKSLTAVVGLVGSGKSSLLSAILGEIRKLEGGVKVKGSSAYISQQAWIQNATLRDNILFGLPYQEAKYSKIVEACALKHDLDILAAGDMTLIGEKGTNLSGGQKQRVSLARSLYQDSDIYLFDDPLSAVDSHVAKHIFNHVIGPAGYLKNKTRVLVTHAVSFLPYTDCVIVLEEGAIVEQGSYNQLSQSGGRLSRFIETIESIPTSLMTPDGSHPVESHPLRSRTTSIVRSSSIARASYERKPSMGEGFDRISSNRSIRSVASSSVFRHDEEARIEEEGDGDFQIVSPESVGEVKFGAYKFYASQLGYVTLTLIVIFFTISKSFAVMSNVWTSYWTDDKVLQNYILNGSLATPNSNDNWHNDYYERQKYYITSYAWFVAGQALFLLCYCVTSVEGNTNASKQAHSSMLHRIIRAPLSFFETTPTGRILNRFSRDLDILDTNLPDLLHQWLAVFTSLISTVIIVTMNIPIFIVVAIILVIIFLILQHFYLPTVRQLKWEESNSRSPIFAQVCEALTGLDTIRAFKKQSLFLRRFDKLINNNTIFNFAANAAERWLGFHLEMLGAFTTFAASMFSVTNRSTLSGSTVGMFMASSIQDSFSLCYLVRLNSSLETNMVSMVRLKEYLQVDVEVDTESCKNKSIDKKPKQKFRKGKIEFQNYCMRYRPDLDYSLKNINILISPGEKIGIIGRTGAGKSSLISALFRFNTFVDGNIFIDDIDTSTLPLKVLRSGITVLPQDPIVFSGSIRMNLDPLSVHSDPDIWNALSKVKMLDSIRSLPGSLDFVCQSDGLNFSVGQRQLLCLGRTLLHKTSILILDEATAAVDLETDKVIQETISTQFAECTVLTIAHRINTILSCDRIMLLDGGTMKEFASPNNIAGLEANNMYNSISSIENEHF